MGVRPFTSHHRPHPTTHQPTPPQLETHCLPGSARRALACFSLRVQNVWTTKEHEWRGNKYTICPSQIPIPRLSVCLPTPRPGSLGDGAYNFRNTEMDLQLATHKQSETIVTRQWSHEHHVTSAISDLIVAENLFDVLMTCGGCFSKTKLLHSMNGSHCNQHMRKKTKRKRPEESHSKISS